MKFKIPAIARVARFSAPDLRPGFFIPDKERQPGGISQIDQIGILGGFLPGSILFLKFIPDNLQGLEALQIDAFRFPAFEKVSIDEEATQSLLRQDLIHSGSGKRL
jgi:hypothetical protein